MPFKMVSRLTIFNTLTWQREGLMRKHILLFFVFGILLSIQQSNSDSVNPGYFDLEEGPVKAGGVKMIPVKTPVGEFKVWTKRFGNNPTIKVLLLHGGPGATHEYLESFESFFPKEGFEFYEYDQLGSYYSDQPTDDSLWTLDRFIDEVEQVRIALGLNKNNFYLYGQSGGGLFAIEYALRYQANLKGLVISNMMASSIDYGKYASDVLAKQMDPTVLKEVREIEAKKDF